MTHFAWMGTEGGIWGLGSTEEDARLSAERGAGGPVEGSAVPLTEKAHAHIKAYGYDNDHGDKDIVYVDGVWRHASDVDTIHLGIILAEEAIRDTTQELDVTRAEAARRLLSAGTDDWKTGDIDPALWPAVLASAESQLDAAIEAVR